MRVAILIFAVLIIPLIGLCYLVSEVHDPEERKPECSFIWNNTRRH